MQFAEVGGQVEVHGFLRMGHRTFGSVEPPPRRSRRTAAVAVSAAPRARRAAAPTARRSCAAVRTTGAARNWIRGVRLSSGHLVYSVVAGFGCGVPRA